MTVLARSYAYLCVIGCVECVNTTTDEYRVFTISIITFPFKNYIKFS